MDGKTVMTPHGTPPTTPADGADGTHHTTTDGADGAAPTTTDTKPA